MGSVQSHQRTTTSQDFSNSLIPFFSPRWPDRTESFGNDRNVGSELAGAAKGTEGSFPKVSNSQCKNSGTAIWSERSIQMRLFLMHEKPEQWNNWSGVRLFCRTIWSFSRSWEQHKSSCSGQTVQPVRIFPLYSAPARPQQECCFQFVITALQKMTWTKGRVQRRVMRMIRGLENMICEGRLQVIRLFSLEKIRQKRQITVLKYVRGYYKGILWVPCSCQARKKINKQA